MNLVAFINIIMNLKTILMKKLTYSCIKSDHSCLSSVLHMPLWYLKGSQFDMHVHSYMRSFKRALCYCVWLYRRRNICKAMFLGQVFSANGPSKIICIFLNNKCTYTLLNTWTCHFQPSCPSLDTRLKLYNFRWHNTCNNTSISRYSLNASQWIYNK